MSENGRQIVAFIVRVTLGFCFVYHGAAKVGDIFGAGGTDELALLTTRLDEAGFPMASLAAHLIAIAQLFAGLTMLVGFFINLSALIFIALMAGAILFISGKHGYELPGCEYHIAILVLALASMALGPGILAYRLQFKKEQPKRPS